MAAQGGSVPCSEPAPGALARGSRCSEQQGKPCAVGTAKETLLTSAKCCFPQGKPTYGFEKPLILGQLVVLFNLN